MTKPRLYISMRYYLTRAMNHRVLVRILQCVIAAFFITEYVELLDSFFLCGEKVTLYGMPVTDLAKNSYFSLIMGGGFIVSLVLSDKNEAFSVILSISILFALAGAFDGYYCNNWIGNGTPVSLAEFGTFILTFIGLLLLAKRTFNQDKQLEIQSEQLANQQLQIEIQTNKEVTEHFTSALTLLASDQTSVRSGAFYSLYGLAISSEKYRKQVVQIMCAHIRGHTQTEKYKKEFSNRPSDEIQTAINLLFKDSNGVVGIYCQDFAKNLSDADLSHSYLPVADFRHAHCVKVNFRSAECQGANFRDAQCQGAYFSFAKCQGADFVVAQCQGAHFRSAECQGANFTRAQCQGANFSYAKCQGAYFRSAECQGAHFSYAKCQGANFRSAECQGTHFTFAECQGADFWRTKCQGADFWRTKCQGVIAKGSELWNSLSSRIGEPTAIENAVFAGGLEDDWLDKLKSSVEICGTAWFEDMKKIHEEHRNKPADNTLPEGIITGVLEDTEEIQGL